MDIEERRKYLARIACAMADAQIKNNSLFMYDLAFAQYLEFRERDDCTHSDLEYINDIIELKIDDHVERFLNRGE